MICENFDAEIWSALESLLYSFQKVTVLMVSRIMSMDAGKTGEGAGTIYRDEHGHRMTLEELKEKRAKEQVRSDDGVVPPGLQLLVLQLFDCGLAKCAGSCFRSVKKRRNMHPGQVGLCSRESYSREKKRCRKRSGAGTLYIIYLSSA